MTTKDTYQWPQISHALIGTTHNRQLTNRRLLLKAVTAAQEHQRGRSTVHCTLSLYTVTVKLVRLFLEGVDGNLSPPLCSPLTRPPPPPQLQPEPKEQLQPQ